MGTEFRTSHVVLRSFPNLLAVLADFTDEGDSAPGIIERDVVADLLEVGLGLWREIGAHRLFPFLGGLGVFALKAVENFGGGLGLPAFSAFVDFTAESIKRGLPPLLFLFQ